MRRSLRLLVAATTSAVALSLLIPLGLLVQRLAEDRAVQAARQDGATLAALMTNLPDDADPEQVVTAIDQRSPLRLSVRLPDGRVVDAQAPPSPGDQQRVDAELARAAAGESFISSAGGSPVVYVPAVSARGTYVARAEVPAGETRRGVGSAVAVLAVLGLVMLVGAVALADVLARRISAPLSAIAETARRLRGGDLAARAPGSGPPEVLEVGTALNDLADRVDELLVAERESVADLAHRLRTPVTALRLASEQLVEPAGERVRDYVADLERAVDGVVRDARRPVASTMSARCDAAAVAAARVAYWTPLAEDRGVRLELSAGGPAPVPVDAGELADVVDALLDNAFGHAEGAGRIEVRVRMDGPRTRVSVGDDGPGLPAGAVVARGASRSGSTGLGLDIARRTARAGGGDLVTGRSRLGGADVGIEVRSAPG